MHASHAGEAVPSGRDALEREEDAKQGGMHATCQAGATQGATQGATHVSGKMTPNTISMVLESCTKCRRAGAHSQTKNQPTAISAKACTLKTVLVPRQI